MGLGGIVLEDLPDEVRRAAGIAPEQMALRVKHVGQYGPHAAAKRAGVKPGDILIGYDGREDLTRESDVLAHAASERKVGDKVTLTLLRGGKQLEIKLPIQE